MHCVKDVKVNDVITFDHSAEIEVRIVLDYCIYLLFVAFVFEVSRDRKTLYMWVQ